MSAASSLPKTQIIASTNIPLVAAGVTDIDESCLLKAFSKVRAIYRKAPIGTWNISANFLA
jgi:hypothetical protein